MTEITEADFQDALTDLGALHEFLGHWKKRTQPLAQRRDEWWLLSRRLLLMYGEEPADVHGPNDLTLHLLEQLAPVVHSSTLARCLPDLKLRFAWPMRPLPMPADRCAFCNHMWTAHNCFDVWRRDVARSDDGLFRHIRCHVLHVRERERAVFTTLLQSAGIVPVMVELPNGYWGREDPTPWFHVTLPMGALRIGWRKRVIAIEWVAEEARCEVDFRTLFEHEKVTLDRYLVHAWGETKAIEYLTRLTDYLVSPAPLSRKAHP